MEQQPAPPLQLAWGPLLQAHPLAHFVYDVAACNCWLPMTPRWRATATAMTSSWP
jgi:hypothetical protein